MQFGQVGQVLDLLLDGGLDLIFILKRAARLHHADDPDVEHELELVNVAYVVETEGIFAQENEMRTRQKNGWE